MTDKTSLLCYQDLPEFHGPATGLRIGRIACLMVFFILATLLHARADADADIPIASIYALTGPVASTNHSSVRGVRMAVKEINAAGGVLGRRLALLELDNRSTPIGSKVAADMAANHHVAAIIGPAFSSHALAVAKVAQAARIPMVTNVATHPNVTAVGDFIFRACFNDRLQGEVMGRFARKHLDARWAVITVNLDSDYSIGLSSAFENAFVRQGGKVLAKLPYNPSQTNIRELVTQILSHDPDVLFVPGHDESARIVDQAIARGLQATPLGGDGWDEETFFSMGGRNIQHGYFSSHWHKAIETDRSRQFVTRYGEQDISTTSSALAYDAVYLVVDAIRRAGSVQHAEIRDALAQTRQFIGVTGPIAFDDKGDPDKGVVIIEIKNGRPYYLQQVHLEK